MLNFWMHSCMRVYGCVCMCMGFHVCGFHCQAVLNIEKLCFDYLPNNIGDMFCHQLERKHKIQVTSYWHRYLYIFIIDVFYATFPLQLLPFAHLPLPFQYNTGIHASSSMVVFVIVTQKLGLIFIYFQLSSWQSTLLVINKYWNVKTIGLFWSSPN